MQTIPLAFFLVMLELSVGAFLTLFILDVRNDSSVNFVRLQAILYLLMFTLLAWATMQGFAMPNQMQHDFGYNLDFRWLNLQPTLLLWFMLLQIPYNVLAWMQSWRKLRIVVGGVIAILGLLCLFAVGMGFRSIEAGTLGGVFTVFSFVSGALALGGVSTAMLLGHWYLNTPTASGKPLEFATGLTMIGIALQVAFGILAGGNTYTPLPSQATGSQTSHVISVQPVTNTQHAQLSVTPTPTTTAKPVSPVPSGVKFSNTVLILLEYVLGLGIPLALTWVALYLERERSFQSATGMLYIAVIFVFMGEILSRNLFLGPLA
jgi:hypothetical protein